MRFLGETEEGFDQKNNSEEKNGSNNLTNKKFESAERIRRQLDWEHGMRGTGEGV